MFTIDDIRMKKAKQIMRQKLQRRTLTPKKSSLSQLGKMQSISEQFNSEFLRT